MTASDSGFNRAGGGKLADLVLVEGDPTHEISDIRRTRLVIKDGALIDVNVLCDALGIARLAPSRTSPARP
jgi:hypothetical protein